MHVMSLIEARIGQPRSRNRNQRHFLLQNNPKFLSQVQLLLSFRQTPVERMNQRRKRIHEHPLSHPRPGTNPSPRPERQILKVVAAIIPLPILKPLGTKLQRVLPHGRVAMDGPHVDEHAGPLGDGVARDGARGAGAVGDEER